MKNINKIKLTINSTIKEALKIIDNGAIRIALVVDEDDKLLGTLSDGDIRRAILNGNELETYIKDIYFKTPIVVTLNHTKEEIINISTSNKVYQIPVIDDKNRVIDIYFLDELLKPKYYKIKLF